MENTAEAHRPPRAPGITRRADDIGHRTTAADFSGAAGADEAISGPG
jgi:hypothetical protein